MKTKFSDKEYNQIVCQLNCARMIFWGGGMDLDTFLKEASLVDKEILKIAKYENMPDFIMDELKKLLK